MNHIHQVANQRGIEELLSDVSLAAESFFTRFGFKVVARQTVMVRGVPLTTPACERRLGGIESVHQRPVS